MSTSINSAMIEPVARCFRPDVARKIVGLRASDALQSKLDELADKCSEGTLTPDEHQLYEAFLRGMNFIGTSSPSST